MIDPVQECFTALSNSVPHWTYTVTRLARSVTQRQKAISRAVASHVAFMAMPWKQIMEPVPSVYYDGYVQNQLQDVVIAIQLRLDEFKKAAEISGITLSLVNEQDGETTGIFRALASILLEAQEQCEQAAHQALRGVDFVERVRAAEKQFTKAGPYCNLWRTREAGMAARARRPIVLSCGHHVDHALGALSKDRDSVSGTQDPIMEP